MMSQITPEILPYDLPDARLLKSEDPHEDFCAFAPPQTLVVVGRGSNPDLEIKAEEILTDSVSVLQRPSGGCSVVLTPDMLVVAMLFRHTEQGKTSEYFRFCNSVIMESLQDLGVDALTQTGTSDIARRGRKIAGTALYRNREKVFFHAIINLASNTLLMERYLKFPPRTPAYRANRSHDEFVTSLKAEGFPLDAGHLTKIIETKFRTKTFQKNLNEL